MLRSENSWQRKPEWVCVAIRTASVQPVTRASGLRAAGSLLNMLFSFSAGYDIDHGCVGNLSMPSLRC